MGSDIKNFDFLIRGTTGDTGGVWVELHVTHHPRVVLKGVGKGASQVYIPKSNRAIITGGGNQTRVRRE